MIILVGLTGISVPVLEHGVGWYSCFVLNPRGAWQSAAELRALVHRGEDTNNPAIDRAVACYEAGRMCLYSSLIPRNMDMGHELVRRAFSEFLKVDEKANGALTVDPKWRQGRTEFCVSDFTYAQVVLGIMLCYGDIGRVNAGEGVKYYQKAAELSDPAGELFLGMAYLHGEGVPKNSELAIRWIRAAAETGVPEAQRVLGKALRRNDSNVSEQIEAYKWLNLAAARGDKNAQKYRDELEQEMGPEQIARAQGLCMLFEGSRARNGTGSASTNTASVGLSPRWMTGTCFFIHNAGYLVTSLHVVDQGKQFFVIDAADLYTAKMIAKDSTNDLALLKIDGRMTNWDLDDPSGLRLVEEVTKQFRPIPIRADRVQLGESVATVGFPNPSLQGFAPKVTRGDVSSVAGPADDPRFFQVSVPVQPGNSGGPLLDTKGNAVGVVCGELLPGLALSKSGSLPQNVNYAVKSSLLVGLIDSVPELRGSLPEPNKVSSEFTSMTEAAVSSVGILMASDADPPLTGKKLKDRK